jgi:hypothetical protein
MRHVRVLAFFISGKETTVFRATKKSFYLVVKELFLLVGAALFVFGCYLIYRQAGYIVAGLILIYLGWPTNKKGGD